MTRFLIISLLIGCSPTPTADLLDGGSLADSTLFDGGSMLQDASRSDTFGAEAAVADGGREPPDCGWVEDYLGLRAQVLANPRPGRRQLDAPIILAHGAFGFDRIGALQYWSRIPSHLRGLGYEVYVTHVDPIAGTDVRSERLGDQLLCLGDAVGAERFHLIGHSQGGLDARRLAHRSEFQGRILSITTLATPHRGTTAADLMMAQDDGSRWMNAILAVYAAMTSAPVETVDVRAQFGQLTTSYLATFNRLYPNLPEIEYRSWAGRSVPNRLRQDRGDEHCSDGLYPNPDGRDVVDPLFALFWPRIQEAEGPNDGLISVSSAKWGEFQGCVPADHLDEVGLIGDPERQRFSGFEYLSLFELIADALQ